MSIEKRDIILYCPTCGNDKFSCLDIEIDDLSKAPGDTRIQCADCKCIFTKAKLIDSNQDILNSNIEEVKQDLMKDLENLLKNTFK